MLKLFYIYYVHFLMNPFISLAVVIQSTTLSYANITNNDLLSQDFTC